jgi:hypothetical protein
MLQPKDGAGNPMVSPVFKNSGYLMFRTPFYNLRGKRSAHPCPQGCFIISYPPSRRKFSQSQKENRPFQAGFSGLSD